MSGSRDAESYRFEFLPEVQDDASQLDDELRLVIAGIVVELHANPWLGEPMDDRWPHNLEGSRKVRFDHPDWDDKPRYRLIYRNEPSDGAVGVMVVLAIERRENMVAHARASARLQRRLAKQEREARRARRGGPSL